MKLVLTCLVVFCSSLVNVPSYSAMAESFNRTSAIRAQRARFCQNTNAAVAAHRVNTGRFTVHFNEGYRPYRTFWESGLMNSLGDGIDYHHNYDYRSPQTTVKNGRSETREITRDDDNQMYQARALALEELFARYEEMGMDSELLDSVKRNSQYLQFLPESYIMIKDETGKVVGYLEIRKVSSYVETGQLAGMSLLESLGVKDRKFLRERRNESRKIHWLHFLPKFKNRWGELDEFEIQRLYISPEITNQKERDFIWEEIMSVWLKENYLDRYPKAHFWALATDPQHLRFHQGVFGMTQQRAIPYSYEVQGDDVVRAKTVQETAYFLRSSGENLANNIERGVRHGRARSDID